ncbi:lanosterol 14-alpha demethylase-like [Diadema antillarum]|uniref:lanosterol 14-alpha demethylase-like n=1 Tax=Diadema antillarum TaxID=105358 RepID=UPI003A8C59D4
MASYPSFFESVGVMWGDINLATMILVSTVFVLSIAWVFKKLLSGEANPAALPPRIPSNIPFLGKAIEFNKSPIEFLVNAYETYGEVVSFTMVGKTFTYLLGSEASALLFNSKNEQLNAEEVYSNLTVPVFGKGVAYDVPNQVFLEQKKILKTGLNIQQFKRHIPMIEEETREYFKRWGDSGEKNLFVALSELIILTASRCLHGKEIRSTLNEEVAQLYADLDGGFTHLAWLAPSWIPFPSFIKRDRAHKKIKEIFYKAIAKRRETGVEDDMLQTLIDSRYKSGRPLSDEEIAGMCIGLLLAGQHTSSTTSAWLGFFVAQNKELQKRCIAEQEKILGDNAASMTYEQIKDMQLLDNCVKETLRLRPPIMTMMRVAKSPLTYKGLTIPAGHQVCVSPTVNQRLKDHWMPDPLDFNPDRFLDDNKSNSEKFAYVPFGAGRHRCIGENFAYVQIKTIWSVLLRMYELELVDGHFPEINYNTMIHTPLNPVIRYRRRTEASS